ncbi:hypothetical protein UFOVP1309_16 [uncultured Caudovirales phage]|uniref:Uncharacterized protein n=1 Tax=uncultured Caudovirales phage TaxID=2100421 RepID=A0A6J5RIY4_9CAUD|nr:hypothetical protein UFOVP1309_16 [uncultured Caudovirales phage]
MTSQRDMTSEDVLCDYDFPIAKRITCKDGFSLSVQATHGAYCLPRTNIGPWIKVEVGYPSSIPEFIMEFAEDQESPTDTVYPYVPIKLVEKLIQFHGGQSTNEQ